MRYRAAEEQQAVAPVLRLGLPHKELAAGEEPAVREGDGADAQE
ncbi:MULTISPECIES: hypothetical protein [unclassified Streptomyces]